MNTTVIKLTIFASIFLAAIAFWKWDRDQAFQAGVDSEKANQLEVLKKAIASESVKIDDALKQKKHYQNQAIQIEKQAKERLKVAYREINEAAKNARCTSLGNDVFVMFNTLIGEEPSYGP